MHTYIQLGSLFDLHWNKVVTKRNKWLKMAPQSCHGDSLVSVRLEHLNSPLILIADTTFVFVRIQQDLLITSRNKVRGVLLLCELSEFTRATERREGRLKGCRKSLLLCRKQNERRFTSSSRLTYETAK